MSTDIFISEEECITKQKKEKKDLQIEIQRLKATVTKGDKKKRQEINCKIAILEDDLDRSHKQELLTIQGLSLMNELTNKITLGDTKDQPEKEADTNLSQTITNNIHTLEPQPQTKISKSQKRRDKKSLKEAEVNERIKLESADAKFSSRNIEAEKIYKILNSRNLSMHKIPSDGDCLFASISHQLKINNLEYSIGHLRNETSNFIREHPGDFMPFLLNKNGGLMTSDDFSDYCNKVATTSEWGGHAELKALSEILHCYVEVLQADGASVDIGINYKENFKLFLVYLRHEFGLGEHYNSVVDSKTIANNSIEHDSQENSSSP